MAAASNGSEKQDTVVATSNGDDRPATAAAAAESTNSNHGISSETSKHDGDTQVGADGDAPCCGCGCCASPIYCARRWALPLTLLNLSSLFIAVPWGFISFGASYMVEHTDLTFGGVGTLLPAFGVARMVCTILLGQHSSSFHPKTLICAALAIIAACQAVMALTSDYWAMVISFTLYGAAYSVFNLIPYDQVLKLVTPQTESLRVTERAAMVWRQLYEVHSQMLGPAGGRFLMMVSVVALEGPFGWRLPWVIVFVATSLNLVLVFCLARLRYDGVVAEHHEEGEAKAARSDGSYLTQARALYCRPVTLVLLLACFLASFSINGVGVWGPTLAGLRFSDSGLTAAAIQGGMSAAAVAAFPIGIGLGSTLLQTVTGVVPTLRLSLFFPAVALVAIVFVMIVSDYLAFVVSIAAFLAFSYFPYILFSSFPTLLKYSEAQRQFVLSRFRVAFTLAGTVIAPAVLGILVESAPLDVTFVVLLVVYCVSCALWLLAVSWTCCRGSPIDQIVDAERRAIARKRIAVALRCDEVDKELRPALTAAATQREQDEDSSGGSPASPQSVAAKARWGAVRGKVRGAAVLARVAEALHEGGEAQAAAAVAPGGSRGRQVVEGDQTDLLDECACCTCCPQHRRGNMTALFGAALSGDRYGPASNLQEARDAALDAAADRVMRRRKHGGTTDPA